VKIESRSSTPKSMGRNSESIWGGRSLLKWLVCLAIISIPPIVWGQAKVGTTGVQFLKIGPSARAVGMAEAFIPVADDAAAVFYNPGGLVQLIRGDAMISLVTLPADIKYGFIGAAQPLPQLNAAMAVSLTYLTTDQMDVTTPVAPNGTGETFNATDFAAGVTYSQRLTDKFSVGGTVKFVNESLADERATGWAADVGTFYNTGWKNLCIAMSICNFGPDLNFVDSPFPLPINFKFGASIPALNSQEHRLLVAVEGSHPNDNLEQLAIGAEYGYRNFAFLRIGKKINGWKRSSWEDYQAAIDPNQQFAQDIKENPYMEYPILDENDRISLDGASIGGGLRFQNIGLRVDYAYTSYGFLGNLHRFTLAYEFRSLW
jgi:hypothetical protein